MGKLLLDERERDEVERIVEATLQILYEQERCGIDMVSAKIEIGALQEIKRRVHGLGNK